VFDMSLDRLSERLLFIGIVVLACLMPAQNDTWWHLRAGEAVLAGRGVLLHDTFSHSVLGQEWENHAWLSQVIFAAVHRVGGMPLLTALCAVAVSAGMWLVYVSTPGGRMRRLALLAAVVSGATITWSVRPQAFTLLLLGVTIFLVSRQRWTLLPLVFLLWANLHSAVGLGLVVLGGAAAGHAIVHRHVPLRVIGLIALCGAATMATPQGLDYWPNIAASMERSQLNAIAEWRRPDWPPAHLTFWVAAAGLAALTMLRGRRLTTATDWGLVCGALLLLPLALSFMRNISPFLMAAAPAAGALLDGHSRDEAVPRAPGWRGVLHTALFWAACIAASLLIARTWHSPPPRMGWHPVSPGAARAIEGCRPALYNTYVDGGPIIFFAPKQRVLLDSRQDPYPVDLVQAEGEVERTGDYEALFAKYRINCAAVPPAAPVRARLERAGWVRRFADAQWVVLERP
jgi:hypothetical protein